MINAMHVFDVFVLCDLQVGLMFCVSDTGFVCSTHCIYLLYTNVLHSYL